jgi:hypothetical protein
MEPAMSDLQPGREMDALVHEQVLGGKVAWGSWGDEPPEPWTPVEGMNVLEALVPRYSTAISAAWEVVEKMQTLGEPGEYDLEIFVSEGSTHACFGSTEVIKATAPHAICLAALRAVGALP